MSQIIVDEKMADAQLEHQEQTVPDKATEVPMTANELLAAYHASLREHSESWRDGVRVGRRAVLWIAALGMITLTDRLNEALLQGVQALPAFQKEFGFPVKGKKSTLTYTLSAWQQQLLSNIPNLFHIAGLLVYGYLVDRFGNRRTVTAALACVLCTVFLCFFAHNFTMILLGTSFQTLFVGFIGAVAPAWCIELAPLSLRPYTLIYVHVTNNIGQLLAAVMSQQYATRTDPMGWRIPYAIQWAFPLPFLICGWLAPESPWWFVRKGRMEEAGKSLARLHNGEIDQTEYISLMQHTVEMERALNTGATYWDCFKGTNRRRTEIALMAAIGLDATAFGLKGAAYFLEAAGLSASHAYALSSGQAALGIVCTLCAGLVIQKAGRRGLWLIGTACLAIDMGIVGALGSVTPQKDSLVWAQGVFVMLQKAFVSISLGSLSAILTTEIGSVRLRRKTQAIGLTGYDLSDFVSGSVGPYLVNPNEANLKGKAAWVPCGINIILFVYGYFRIPETRNRNSEELDILFANKVPARRFASYKIDQAQEFHVKEAEAVPRDIQGEGPALPTLE